VNWFKKGPELKLSSLKPSELKVPPFLSDLYWDLRDRRLLPFVALAIVAIVAVPFLLGGGSKSSPPPAPATPGIGAPGAGSVAAGSSSLTVVEAKPGLRDPRKRLAGRRPTDPFEQRFTGPQLKGARLNGSTSTSTTTTTTTTGSSTGSGSTSGGAPSGSETAPVGPPSTKGGGESGHLTFFTFAIDVKVKLVPGEASGSSAASSTAGASSSSNSGSNSESGSDQPTVRRGVQPATPLPGKKAPVVTYMGAIGNAKTALFMVSPEVTSVFGDAKCLSGTNSCQLLGVETGVPETFAYGFAHNRLKIEVLKIKPVVTGHS
jgi:hypothetical protein